MAAGGLRLDVRTGTALGLIVLATLLLTIQVERAAGLTRQMRQA